MTENNGYYKRDPRLTVGSALLLTIFVGAVLFVAYMAYTIAPWESDDPVANDTTAAAGTQEPGATSDADDPDEAAVEGRTDELVNEEGP